MATRIFSDVDLSFEKHPVSKDIFSKTNENAIKNAVKNLVLTKHFERPFHSEIGSNVNNLLFENTTPLTVQLLKQEIRDVITNFEPRVDVIDINVTFSPDNNLALITLLFKIKNTQTPLNIEFTLNRTR